jgi:hypothetical protein
MDEALNRHRLRYRMSRFPDGLNEPRWRWDDLTAEQRADVQAFADEWPIDDPDPMRWALAEYAIECVHVWENPTPKYLKKRGQKLFTQKTLWHLPHGKNCPRWQTCGGQQKLGTTIRQNQFLNLQDAKQFCMPCPNCLQGHKPTKCGTQPPTCLKGHAWAMLFYGPQALLRLGMCAQKCDESCTFRGERNTTGTERKYFWTL